MIVNDNMVDNDNIGLSRVMGVPQVRWMVDFMENANLKWMITGGTPMTMETPICEICEMIDHGIQSKPTVIVANNMANIAQ